VGGEVAGYRIEALLGRGGTAAVYRAHDVRLGRNVALKLLVADLGADERFRERFLQESRLAASLDHPNVIPIYEAGEADGLLYIAMRYVEGTDLEALIAREGALEPARALDILSSVAGALDAAHDRGLVHRDVKPGNVLIAVDPTSDPPGDVYLSDFGLTKHVAADLRLTQSGQFVGTAKYVAPEQIAGGPLDGRADQYSLGCVLFECLTGAPPFAGEELMPALWAHLNDAPPSPRSRRPSLPRELDAVFERALAKRAAERYTSCRELIAEARRALEQATAAQATRMRPERVLPGLLSGTVTFLFTDIEGSTRLLDRLGERYAEVLNDHHRLLGDVFAEHGGQVVDTQGDAFFVAFERVDDAVAAAASVQRRLEAHPWPEDASVCVRIGVHTGEPLVVGDHYVGMDVHRGARIAAAAHGGQVLVSQRTRELVTDSETGPTLRDLGAHRLKDLPEPERLFQVVVEGLPSSFPPPRVYEEALASAGLPDYSLPPADVPCPYKGLEPFQPDDADLFFGREELVAELVGRLEEVPLLAVVGPSGSGKSSLVRAGMVPRLERRTAIVTPGAHPLHELRAAGDSEALVVDQFEEVFALCRDDDERRVFIEAILLLADRGNCVILALRADFYGHCASYPRLAAALEEHQALLGPMREEELRRAIERPAEQAGLILEPGFVEGVLRDVVGEPGALPLLSHCLLEIWKRRSGRMLTLIGYLQSGGVQGAVAKTAETVYRDALTPEQQRLARNIFLRLTELGESTEDTRRRVSLAEIVPRTDPADVEEVLRVLTDARLITVGEDTVEVAHEALIRHWPTLRAWLDEDREGRLVHRRLTEAAKEWERLGMDPAAVYRGGRLATATEWATQHDDELNELEREFLRSSREAELGELETTKRRNRRLRILVAALAVLLVGAAVLGVVAFRQKGVADEQSRVARSREIAATALEQLERDPQLTLLLAIEASENAPTAQSEAAVRTALVNSHLRGVLPVESPSETTFDVSPDGKVIATGTPLGQVALWDRASGRRLAVLERGREPAGPGPPGGGPPTFPSFSPDGKRLYTGRLEGGHGRIWSVPDGRLVTHLRGGGGFIPGGWTPDGRSILTASGGVARLWDTTTGSVRRQVRVKGPARERLTFAVLSPDGRLAAIQDGDRTVRLVRMSTGETVRLLEGRLFPGRGFSPDGRRLVLNAERQGLRIFDVSSGRLVRFIPRRRLVYDAAFSRDGRRIIAAGQGNAARIWDVGSGRPLQELGGHGSDILDVSFSPDGTLALTGSEDSTARLWDAGSGRVVAVLAGHTGPVGFANFTPDGRFVVTASADVRVWEVPAGAAAVLRGHEGPVVNATFSPDGKSIVSSDEFSGNARIWNAETRRLSSRLRPPKPPGAERHLFAEFSADGRFVLTSGFIGGPNVSEQEPARLWDFATQTVRAVFVPTREEKAGKFGQQPPAPDAALRPDGKRVATIGEFDGSLRIWDVANGTALKTVKLGEHGEGVEWTPDGRRIVALVESRIQVIDAITLRTIRKFGPEEEHAAVSLPAVSPKVSADGSLVAVGYNDRTARVWEIATGRLVAELPHAGPVYGVAFSPNGEFLVAASGNAPTIWDLESQRPLVRLFGHQGAVVPVDFSPDGSSIVSGGVDRSVRIWRCEVCAPMDEVLRLARSRVLRELTPAERARFLG
jgi:WD40 repeat protein/class 3 adenylate cyclase